MAMAPRRPGAGSLEAASAVRGDELAAEITQAPGRAGLRRSRHRCPLQDPTPIFAIDAGVSAEVVWTGGMRWGRTQTGKAMMTAV